MGSVTNPLSGTPSSGGTTSTSDTTSYISGSHTPAGGVLLAYWVQASGTAADAPTLTASANSLTFTLVPMPDATHRAIKNSSADSMYLFIADQLTPGSPSAMTVTFTCTADAATGAIISPAATAGMIRTGLSAIRSVAGVRQVAKVDNVAGGTAPSVVLPAACLTTNPTLFGIHTTTAGGATPPTGWTERSDVTYATPTQGGGYDSRDSGFTGTTITSGSTTNGACSAIAVELDTSPTIITGTGASTAPVAAAAGTGTVGLTGAGTTSGPSAVGAAAAAVRLTGSGASHAPTAAAAGAGGVSLAGSGAETAPAAHTAASGAVRLTGSATAHAGPAVAHGAGQLTSAGAGHAVAPAPAAAGAANIILPVAGPGVALAPAARAAGSGTLVITGVGAAAAAAGQAAGFAHAPAGPGRLFKIPADDRVHRVPAEDRIYRVPAAGG